jgi:dynein heavy chain
MTGCQAQASSIFFSLGLLATLDPMYQFSLSWFSRLFVQSIGATRKGVGLAHRLELLSSDFVNLVHRSVARSLFERHRLLFSFLLALAVLERTPQMPEAEHVQYLMRGLPSTESAAMDNPCSTWLPDSAWAALVRLDNVKHFHGTRPCCFLQDMQHKPSVTCW